MSTPQQGAFAGAAKKAVHVKWAGKTIALGTFPAAEADEKCARAKALTRAWRSSMRPKPSRDWVMVELERLGVRVVSGRLGRKAGEEGEDGGGDKSKAPHSTAHTSMPQQAPGVGGPADRSPSLGWGSPEADLSSLMARRNSLGLSMMNDAGRRGSLGSLGQVVGMDAGPGDFDAATFQKSGEQQRRNSSLGLGTLTGGSGLGSMGGMSVNPNQHYEMLKLHHMNLLNEIQETTLMMNLYQQQQLQQQQQAMQQAGADSGSDPQIAMLLQQQQQQNQGGMDPMFGSAQLQQQQRASLGLGTSHLSGSFGSTGGQQQQMHSMMSQQQLMHNSSGDGVGSNPQEQSAQSKGKSGSTEQAGASSGDNKRSADSGNADESNAKRTKVEEPSR